MNAEIRNHIRFRRSEIARANTQPRRGPQTMETHEDWVIEVDTAIAAFRKDGPWPPNVHVPAGMRVFVST